MSGFWLDKGVQDQLKLWLALGLVLLSFVAHLILALFAGTRRREDSGRWRMRNLVWLAYQVTDKAPKAALGKLFLDSPSSEQQLFAFWVPFLLLHLGLPDTISAYSLEDNVLSARQVFDISSDLGGALYGAYKQKLMGGDWVLGSAFWIMFFLGFCKYVERAFAVLQGGFARIRKSNMKKPLWRFTDEHAREELDNDDALLDAHGLLGITMGAFADYSVNLKEKHDEHRYFRKSYSYWYDVVKVVEMELSLMYDIMYTKAAVIHTWPGYLIRVASAPLTFTALMLFHFRRKADHREVDIRITYLLLIGTLLLDVIWLLRALGSTWTYAFLTDTECNLLMQTLCCRRGKWYRLRHFLISLDPFQLYLRSVCPKGSYRMWSRTVGQHNLLHWCTHDGIPLNKIGWKGDSRRVGVRSLLEELCRDILKTTEKKKEEEKRKPAEKMKEEEKRKPAEDDEAYKRRRVFGDARLFGPEFDELVIAWHIATDVFLLWKPESKEFPNYRKIKAMSDYMMFLVAEHPEMLPGLRLHSNYENTRFTLKSIWEDDNSNLSSYKQKEEKLARKLQHMGITDLRKLNTILSEAIEYAKVLQFLCLPKNSSERSKNWSELRKKVPSMKEESEKRLLFLVPGLLEYAIKEYSELGWFTLENVLNHFILKSWVRLIIFASTRCNRDSHAKQISRGGELTTIVWMLAEHKEIVRYREPIRNSSVTPP